MKIGVIAEPLGWHLTQMLFRVFLRLGSHAPYIFKDFETRLRGPSITCLPLRRSNAPCIDLSLPPTKFMDPYAHANYSSPSGGLLDFSAQTATSTAVNTPASMAYTFRVGESVRRRHSNSAIILTYSPIVSADHEHIVLTFICQR